MLASHRFFEISYGAIIRLNTAARNGFKTPSALPGGGIAVTLNPHVEIYGNTLINHRAGFAINQDNRPNGAMTYGPRN